jgi:deoxyribonuclease-4
MARHETERVGRATALPLIGAHISSAGGFDQVPPRAIALGAEAVQLFSSNPRTWQAAPPESETLAAFGACLREQRLPLFFHAIYLINLASPDSGLRARSAQALAHALVTGALAGAGGVVVHVGSHRGEGFERALPLIEEAVHSAVSMAWQGLPRPVKDSVAGPALPMLLLETGAGSGATVGDRLEELAALLALLDPQPRTPGAPELGLCLDTAHMFAAGYALHQDAGLASLIAELEQSDLMRRVGLIHLNDSVTPFASRRDRHANPGEGEIGFAGLARVVRHPALAGLPFVLEVPGADGHGPGAAQIALVKSMRQGPPDPPPAPAPGGRDPTAPA